MKESRTYDPLELEPKQPEESRARPEPRPETLASMAAWSKQQADALDQSMGGDRDGSPSRGEVTFAGPIQRRAAFAAQMATWSKRQADDLDKSVAGSGERLPHGDQIQEAFGHHDVSGIRAHVGGDAGQAATAIGAEAFATGDAVGFTRPPDLHTAAHEAAHVVQQRAGVVAFKGLNEPGDAYEQHADAVADAVVAGGSAASLLDAMPRGGSSNTGAVQRRPGKGTGAVESEAVDAEQVKTAEASGDTGPRRGQRKAETPMDYAAAANELRAASDIVENRSPRLIGSAPGHDAVLTKLYSAAVGRGEAGAEIDARGRLRLFEEAMAGLRPAIAALKTDPEGVAWLDENLNPGLERLRGDIRYQIASQRVEGATLVGAGAVVEEGAESARAHAPLLRAQIQKQIGTLALLNELAIRIGEHEIKHAAEQMMMGHVPPAGKSWSDPGLLAQLQGVLYLADGWLTLTDEELPHHLAEIEGVAGGVASYAHLFKGIVELLGGTVSVSATFVSVIAKRTGQASYAAQAAGLARRAILPFSAVVSVVEIVHGIAVLCDSHATPEEKEKAILGIGMGSAGVVGIVAGPAVGGPLSVGVLSGYLQLKLAAYLFGSANYNIIGGWMQSAFENIESQGRSIASASGELAKAGPLLEREKDPEQQRALATVQENAAVHLGSSIDYFINDCQPRTYAAGVARYPGAYNTLREVFAPIMGLGGKKAPQDAAAAGAKVLDRMVWCLTHQQEIVDLAVRQKELDTLSEGGEGGHGKEGHGQGHGGGHGEEG